jgi:glycerate kinase
VASMSLLDEFGPEASWGDPLGCVRQAAAGWLDEEWTAQ